MGIIEEKKSPSKEENTEEPANNTEVVNETKNVIIESAIFDGVRVRKTSKKIVRSEASNRFEKGLDPKKTYMAIDRACELLEKYADGNVRNGMCKYDITNSDDKKIKISYKSKLTK